MLEDDEGLVAALEKGIGGPALDEGAVPGLRMGSGRTEDRDSDAFGRRIETAIRFDGDEPSEIAPPATGQVVVRGEALRAMAIASWSYQGEFDCDGVARERSWGVFRWAEEP